MLVLRWADLASLGFTGELMQKKQGKSNAEKSKPVQAGESPAVDLWQAFQYLDAAQVLPPDDKASQPSFL